MLQGQLGVGKDAVEGKVGEHRDTKPSRCSIIDCSGDLILYFAIDDRYRIAFAYVE